MRGGIENRHSNDVEYPAPAPLLCMRIHSEGKSCSELGQVLVLNDPPRVTRCDPISTWEINMGERYGRSDINEISIYGI